MEIAELSEKSPENPDQRAPPMRDALLQARITRRSALKMASVAAMPALIRPVLAAEPSSIRVAFAIQPATLDPQKMRVGGVDYNYVYNCFSRLTAQDPQLQVQPDLATSWDATLDADVAHSVDAVGRVDHPPIRYNQIIARLQFGDRRARR
jgi:hypothetical protein